MTSSPRIRRTQQGSPRCASGRWLLALTLCSCATARPPPLHEEAPIRPAAPRGDREWRSELEGGRIRLSARVGGPRARALAYAPHRPWLATVTERGVTVHDVERDREVVALRLSYVDRVAWNASGDVLLTARTLAATTRLESWQVPSGRLLAKTELPGVVRGFRNDWEMVVGYVHDYVVAMAPPPRRGLARDVVLLATFLSPPRLYDARRGAMLATLRGTEPYDDMLGPSAIAWAPTGDRVGVRYGDGRLRVWSVPSGALLLSGVTARAAPRPSLADSQLGSPSLAFDPTGRTVAVATEHGIELWEVGAGRLATRDFPQPKADPLCGASALAFLPDGSSVLGTSALCRHPLFVWTPADGRLSAPLVGKRWQWAPFAVSTDGERVLLGGVLAEQGPSGLETLGFFGHFSKYAWSSDLRWITTSNWNEIATWRVVRRPR